MSVVGRTIILGGTVAIMVVARSSLPLDDLNEVAEREIPAPMVDVYKAAAGRCMGLSWEVLAGIGWVETRHGGGRVDPGTGELAEPIVGAALSGRDGSVAVPDPGQSDGWARPLGPMGLLPASWGRHATRAPGRPAGATPSVHNAWDAIHATAEELCGGAPFVDDLNRALRAHSPRPSYVAQVLTKAAAYGWDGTGSSVATVVADGPAETTGWPGRRVVEAAAQVLGTPYVWGGESPEEGFDCSGLVWWAYRQAGIDVARTTASQINSGAAVLPGSELRTGDLLFTRGGRPVRDGGHVGIYAGGGLQVIAPRSGKSVTVEPVDFDKVQAVRRILAG